MMKVADIMTPDVVTIPSSATVAAAVKLMRQRKVHTLLVDRNHNQDAYGIVTTLDIIAKVTAFGRDPRQVRIFEIMTKPCIVLNPDLGVEYAARLLTMTGIHSAPVIQTHLLGILSITNILEQGDFLEHPQAVELEKKIQHLIQTAQATCEKHGPVSEVCRKAWAAANAAQAEAAHQQAGKVEKTSFERYQEQYPEAFKGEDSGIDS